MKTIASAKRLLARCAVRTAPLALLSLGAIVFGQQQSQDPNHKARDKKAASRSTAALPSTARQNAATVSQPARRNLHKGYVAPVVPPLTPEQKAAAALPTVPEGAKPAGPNLFRYTDPQGKTWMYRQTPFGVSKWEEKPGEQQPNLESPKAAPATMTDLGDTVQFERMTPFGPQKWTRKKSELTDEEKATLAEQEHARQAVKPPSEKQ